MITVRFAPSPTGWLHIGSARTAIFNWLFARRHGGRLLLRVEDTDIKRSDPKFLEEILSSLRWLGIDWDGEPVFQSRRFPLYRERAEQLVAEGKARRDGEAILFPVEAGRTIEVRDMIHGSISFDAGTFKEQVLIKSDGSPAYNFSCVVDDADMGVTDILRGDDHISNTPKQILFYEALGLEPPRFGHMPLILGQDGAKLSKRHGGTAVEEYRSEGFLPEALANYLILLGWYPGEDREILSMAEAANMFSLEAMNDVQAKFDLTKLKWLNGEYIMKGETADLLPDLRDRLAAAGLSLPEGRGDAYLASIIDLYKIRIKTLGEFPGMTDFFFTDAFAMEEDAAAQLAKPGAKDRVRELAEAVAGIEPFSHDTIETACRAVAEAAGVKAAAVIHPARAALSGKTKGAGLFEIMEVLGREKVLERLRRAS